jgi:polar amino acid transport system substrate-binding protein
MLPSACLVARFALVPRLLALLCLFVLAWPACADGAETLVLNTADPAPLSRPGGTGLNDRIVAEACHRLGIEAQLVRLSAERALQNADQGIDDGTYARIKGLSASYPNLVMVPEPIAEFLFTAFTKDTAMQATGWAGLKPYNVGLITGWKIVEANTRDARSVFGVKDEKALFALLEHGRADVVVLDLYSGKEAIRSMGLVGVRALEPPLTRQDMHLYLNRRHADLVPKLAEVLRQMRRDGTSRRLARAGLGDSGQ